MAPIALSLLLLATAPAASVAPTAAAASPATPPASVAYDAALAKRLGADERGMRSYVLVVLKSGPTPVTDPEKRKAMFAGHFANMERLSKAGKLVLAGPFEQNADGWRGLFVFAVATVEEARALADTDPVIVNGEMVADYKPWYGSAAVMAIREMREKVTPPPAAK